MMQHKTDEVVDYYRLRDAYLRYEQDRSSEAEAELIKAQNNTIARHGCLLYRSWHNRIRSLVFSI